MKAPDHLNEFDSYSVRVPSGIGGAPDRWIEEMSLGEAVRTARTFCEANRRRITIHHRGFGMVAAVRPIGQTSVVVWFLHPQYSRAIGFVAWTAFLGGVILWLMTISALA